MELTKKNCMTAKNRMRGLAYSSCNCKEENIDEVNNCDNYLEQLINEHFDNPPLKFEDLEEGMWVWDDKNKAYALVDKWAETGSCLVDIYTIKISKNPSNEIVDTIYKNKFENERFYCREVSQGGQKND